MGLKKVVTSVDMTKAKAWVNEKIKLHDIDVVNETFPDKFTFEVTHKEPTAKINKRKA